jgi:hypothetical protein
MFVQRPVAPDTGALVALQFEERTDGGEAMKKRLVPLKMHDYLEEIVPYIAKMAEPGASASFSSSIDW